MNIKLKEVTVGELVEGYVDNKEDGVMGYSGNLDIRPPYQREFVYKDKQRDEVINTVQKGFPLNVMYWVKQDSGYEVLDGQQRTISLCQYCAGDYSINYRGFHNLTEGERKEILNYKLMVYVCEGTDKEKLEWFKIVNIAGEKLTIQELRNSVYVGEWLSDAKRHFSKSNCPAYNEGKKYVKGKVNRQDFLETALGWIADKNDCKLEDYMASHQHDEDASELWMYFQEVISWVNRLFPNYRRKIMKGVNWGYYYNRYHEKKFNSNDLEKEIKRLILDEDVTKKSGICEYLIDGSEKYLNIRNFTQKMKLETYENQEGICVKCNDEFDLDEMQADHITPWSKSGKTIKENCQLLCKDCNRKKSDI